MKKKEVILEVSKEPMIKELLEKGFLTNKQLVEFVISEQEEEDQPEQEESPEDPAEEPTEQQKVGILQKFADAYNKIKGKSFKEKLQTLGKALETSDNQTYRDLGQWITAEDPLALEKELKKRLELKKSGPEGAAKAFDLPTLEITINVSIGLGRRVLEIIKKIDDKIGWDPNSRQVPDAVKNLDVGDDQKAQQNKIEKIDKYEKEISRIARLEQEVLPQVNLVNGEPRPGSNEFTVFNLRDLLTKPNLAKLRSNQAQYETVATTLGKAFTNPSGTEFEGLEDADVPPEWKALNGDALGGIVKYFSNINQIKNQLEAAEKKADQGESSFERSLGEVRNLLRDSLGGLTLPEDKKVKDMSLYDFFPTYKKGAQQ